MLPKAFWCIVIVPSVEGADQRGAAQIDRADKGPLLGHRAEVVNVTNVKKKIEEMSSAVKPRPLSPIGEVRIQ